MKSAYLTASNLLKPALSGGTIRCIGSTTYKEFRNHFEKDRALLRRFQKIDVNEPTIEDTIKILAGLRSAFEEHHSVKYSDDAIIAAVKLSSRYVTDRRLPDKAIDQIDTSLLVEPARAGHGHAPGVTAHRKVRGQTPDPGREFEIDVDPLRTVLEVPAALRIRLVISGDEFDQLLVLEQAPFGLRATTAKRATGLCALVTHEPVAACIQPKPAVTMRHARPLGHGLLDDVIHGVGPPCCLHVAVAIRPPLLAMAGHGRETGPARIRHVHRAPVAIK